MERIKNPYRKPLPEPRHIKEPINFSPSEWDYFIDELKLRGVDEINLCANNAKCLADSAASEPITFSPSEWDYFIDELKLRGVDEINLCADNAKYLAELANSAASEYLIKVSTDELDAMEENSATPTTPAWHGIPLGIIGIVGLGAVVFSERPQPRKKILYLSFNPTSWEQYGYWQEQDAKTLRRINQLLKSIQHDGISEGVGKPERLRHEEAWSRRIDDFNRLVYKIQGEHVIILSCRGHYGE